jgi:hypothetical protein
MNKKAILTGILCVFVCFMMAGCKTNQEAADPSGVLLQAAGCKQFGGAAHVSRAATAQEDDCFEYQYDGKGKLTLRHINAGFNCCPGHISAAIDFNGGVIEITESEELQDCRCLCLFDLDYEIINLAAGRYTIRVIEPYCEAGDQVLEIMVNLSAATSGSFCLQRNYYPWVF